MKYKYIELCNYAGIYNGMHINQIKIDFSKCKTNKIIIRGDNGSGKSTLMKAINPNPDSNDNFIPGVEARKNICLVDNGIEYLIRYIHPVNNNGDRGTTKGYISKYVNGSYVELNSNGNISSCKDILYGEFNLDANFIALSQLSSEDKGLVDKKPAERKKFINGIINVLEVYNNIYKVLNKKSSIFKSTINSLSYKIDNIGDGTTLQLNIKSIENRIKLLETEKNNMIEAAATVKVKMQEINKILQDNNYDDIVNQISLLSKNVNIVEKELQRILSVLKIDNYEEIENIYKELNITIISKETELELLKQKIPMLLAERENEYKQLQDKNERLKSLQSDYNYIDIKNAKEKAKNIIDEYDTIFNKMGLLNINLISKEEYDAAMESLHYLKDSAVSMTSNYSLDLLHNVFNNRYDIKKDMINQKSERLANEKMKSDLSSLQKEISIYETQRSIAKELANRPKNCKIDSCPYIESALEADKNYPESKYNQLLNEYNSLKQSIEISDNKIKFIDEASEVVVNFESIERELKSKIKFINKLPIRKDFINTFIERLVNNDQFNDITDLYKYIDCGNMIEEYKIAKQNYHNYEVEYKIYESKNEMIDSIINDVKSLTQKTNELENSIASINNDINEKNNNLISLKDLKAKLETTIYKINNDLKPSKEKLGSLNESKSLLENNVNSLNSLHTDLNSINNKLGSIDNEIKNVSKERDSLKHASELLKEYKNELLVYKNKYTKIEKIKYYSSPSTGIQTLFMELYMNKIITIANELLSLLFNGEFTILPFIINENEFRIPCVGSGLRHDDISSMSTAQKSMISMILSFSLLHQSSTKYNIIKLDEIDGPLDTSNRNYFITLLDELMNLLKCEQSFIVSHNNELSSQNSDVILLRNDSKQVYTGNIIWQY